MEVWLCTIRDPVVSSDLSRFSSWTVFLTFQTLLVASLWDVDSCRLVSMGSDPVCCLLGLEDSVWASCANQVTIIQESSLQTQVDQLSSLSPSLTSCRCQCFCLPLTISSESGLNIWNILEDVQMGFDCLHPL